MSISHGSEHRETPVQDAKRAAQALPSSARWAKDRVFEAVEAIEDLFKRKELGPAVATGFQELDSKMGGGLRPGEMVVIAGRPCMGKTAFALQVSDHVAVESKLPVAIFSLDLSASHLTQRLLCSRARISFDRMQKGLLTNGDFARLLATTPQLAEAPLLIDDGPDLDIEEIGLRLTAAVKVHGVQLAVVDFLQLLRRTADTPPENLPTAIAQVSGRIKSLAGELMVPIVVLSPLNRNLENRKDYWPRLDDIRGTRQIARDADVVLLLYREEVYASTAAERRRAKGMTTVIIAKHPGGTMGSFPLGFDSNCERFHEITIRTTRKRSATRIAPAKSLSVVQ